MNANAQRDILINNQSNVKLAIINAKPVKNINISVKVAMKIRIDIYRIIRVFVIYLILKQTIH